ncbi:MAG: DUF4410 domain-containing protein [Pseudolabrys sp.]
MRTLGTAHIRPIAALTAALVVAGCSSANISSLNVFDFGGGKPERIIVGAIVVPPGSVQLDASVAAQLRRRARREDNELARQRLISEVSAIITETVVAKLTGAGLAAGGGISTIEKADERTLLVDGTVTTINEGNRVQRNIIGFGAGRSHVSANVTVAMADSAGRKQLLSFRADADSGRRPGAVATAPVAGATAGAAAAAGSAAASGAAGQILRADVEVLARNLGNAIADKVIEYAIAQGWVPKPA